MRTKAAQRGSQENTAKAQPQRASATHQVEPRGAASLLHLQRTHGNRFVQQMLTGVVLQRIGACGGACAKCRDEQLSLQRRSADSTEPAAVPSIVPEVLRSPGQPLDSTTRGFMEPRFRQDFSQVRVHTDARTDGSARTVNALAYNFRRDKGAPRQTGSGKCDYKTIRKAAEKAEKWLNHAHKDVVNYIAALPERRLSRDERRTSDALERHFHGIDKDTAVAVGAKLFLIQHAIKTWRSNARSESDSRVTVHCAGEKDPGCAGATGYVPRGSSNVYICPGFFLLPSEQPATIVHEFAHALLGAGIIDIAYTEERAYRYLRGDEAVKNAGSYEGFVLEIAKGSPVVEKAPLDVSEDCPWWWRWPIHRAIARAQQWNRMALFVSREGNIPKAMKELGIKENPTTVRSVFKWVDGKLESPIHFQCEEECDTNTAVYWDLVFGGDLHVCPDWVSEFLRSQDGAIETMLSGLYGYLASVDERSTRNYAMIARKLVEWYLAGAVITTK